MYHKTVLDNGLRIVSETIPHIRTVAVGIWVDVGSRDEHDLNNGCSHFVEHMLFKGTGRRSALQIAMELDVLGGVSNAFTSRETTCFYATVLDSHLPQLADLFIDMLTNSEFSQEEVNRERHVILQEINMVEDIPDDQIHDLFAELLWGFHPLGNTVLGNREVVASMDTKKLQDFISRYYSPDRIMIAAAGNVEHDNFVDLWQELGRIPRSTARPERIPPAERQPLKKVHTKTLEQVHAILGTYGLPLASKERYKLILLNILLGGNMSSRLFQEIREKRGLAYSIYSFLDSYIDSGYVGIYLGVDRETFNEAISLISVEIDKLRQNSITATELTNAKEYAKGGLFLSAENMEARMTRIARNEYCFERYISFDEVAESLDGVTRQEVTDLAGQIFSRDMTAAVLGPVENKEINWKLLK